MIAFARRRYSSRGDAPRQMINFEIRLLSLPNLRFTVH